MEIVEEDEDRNVTETGDIHDYQYALDTIHKLLDEEEVEEWKRGISKPETIEAMYTTLTARAATKKKTSVPTLILDDHCQVFQASVESDCQSLEETANEELSELNSEYTVVEVVTELNGSVRE